MHAGERVAQHGVAAMADGERPGRIGREKLDLHLAARADLRAPEALSLGGGAAQLAMPEPGAIRKLINPGPATLTSATSGGSSRLARMISAIARGGFFSARAITSAALLAASPWAGSLGASTLAAAGGAVVVARRRARAR